MTYRETADRSLRDKAVEYITQAFPSHRDFYPRQLFIATWNEVGYYDSQNDKVTQYYRPVPTSYAAVRLAMHMCVT